MKLDWRAVLLVPATQFAPWLVVVLLATWGGYPGVVCVTPVAWLIALRVGLVCVGQSRSAQRGRRLLEAALAGALIGLLQGLLFWVVIPRMGPILPSEQAQAIGLVVVIGAGRHGVWGGAGAVYRVLEGTEARQRRPGEARGIHGMTEDSFTVPGDGAAMAASSPALCFQCALSAMAIN